MRHAPAIAATVIALLGAGAGTASANRSGQWEVIAVRGVCPKGILCKPWVYERFFYPVRNYGQAVVLAARLTAKGWQVTIEPAPVPS